MENLAVTLRALHVAAPVSSSFSLVSSSHLLRAGNVLLSSTLFTHGSPSLARRFFSFTQMHEDFFILPK
ncbi:hypothetical protein LR48_Vigan04g154400 [Vigna angularis]|uniref:Uncharacterized protein n=1 Tax=Phaseolus angularis TaxID=3914 RepID=A0A0L9UF47_PHAAN|nr:hypothetical protein LR48_Vigan04g154400 [Vigna angularis]